MRLTSRLMVDGARPKSAEICRKELPRTSPLEISSRSLTDRSRQLVRLHDRQNKMRTSQIYWKGDDVALQPSVEGVEIGLLGESAIPLHGVRLLAPAA